jgi:hypothetical protein
VPIAEITRHGESGRRTADRRVSFVPRYRPPSLHAITENESPQDMPVALLLIVGAVAHQRHSAPSRELLHQAQRKLLAMVLNGTAPLVDGPVKKKLLSVLP